MCDCRSDVCSTVTRVPRRPTVTMTTSLLSTPRVQGLPNLTLLPRLDSTGLVQSIVSICLTRRQRSVIVSHNVIKTEEVLVGCPRSSEMIHTGLRTHNRETTGFAHNRVICSQLRCAEASIACHMSCIMTSEYLQIE